MVFQPEFKPKSGSNPYCTPAISGNLTTEAPQQILQNSILHSAAYTGSHQAQKAFQDTHDLRKALIVAHLSHHMQLGTGEKPIALAIQAMVQYHIAGCRSLLSHHQSPSGDHITLAETSIPPSRDPSTSWQVLQRHLQDFEQQYLLLRRLKTTNKLPGLDETSLDRELIEFDYFLQETRAVLTARREQLDHELNETLLRESRANLKIAQQSMKESQQSGLRECLGRPLRTVARSYMY